MGPCYFCPDQICFHFLKFHLSVRPVLEGSPLWLVSRPLGSRLLPPFRPFYLRPLLSYAIGEGKTAPSFHCWSHTGQLCLGLPGTPIAAPRFFPQADSMQVTWLVVVGLHSLPFGGYHLVLCKYCSSVFGFVLCLLCVFMEGHGKIPKLCCHWYHHFPRIL